MTKFTPELLAPAGSEEALAAAIDAGADAVYFGGSSFSCRMRAKNFTEEQLVNALNLCRDYRVRSYITVNAKLFDNELDEALRFVSFLWEKGASALILSDIGLARLVHESFPDFELHASTQFSTTSTFDIQELQKCGFSRVVCPREFSKEQISQLCNASPLDIEMFIHGAHCVSFSGQCMMSFAMGGRSGNRGECAQPCRLPYTIPNAGGVSSHPLSMKDMSLAQHIPEILSSGVTSLKIEGRQKSADYVHLVTSVWRKLLDERRNATESEMGLLLDAFNRQGFTDGYFVHNYRKMGGYRPENEQSKTPEPFTALSRKLPLDLSFTAHSGQPLTLHVSDGTREAEATGPVPAPAEKHPLTEESAIDSLGKLGGSAFELRSFQTSIDDGLWATKAQLNQLRRDALEKMLAPESPRAQLSPKPIHFSESKPKGAAKKIGVFQRMSQIPSNAFLFFDELRLPLSEAKEGFVPVLPPVLTDRMVPEVLNKLRSIPGCSKAVVHNFGQIALVKSLGLSPIASFRFNVFNRASFDELLRMGACSIELSPELSLGAIRHFSSPKAFMVYGRLPLMLTQRCALSSGGDCCTKKGPGGNDESIRSGTCSGQLIDRTNAVFPMISEGCQTAIYNSVTTYMSDKPESLSSLGLQEEIYLFTNETKAEAEVILRQIEKHSPFSGAIRRIK